MPREADSFEIDVHAASAGQTLGDEMAVKNITGGRFSGVVTIPMSFVPGENMSYTAKLSVCNEGGSCFWPLGSGAPAWAQPGSGSSPHISDEGALTGQDQVNIPTFTMAGNNNDAREHTIGSLDQDSDLEVKDTQPERSDPKPKGETEDAGVKEFDGGTAPKAEYEKIDKF
jgi:hypothetical protein